MKVEKKFPLFCFILLVVFACGGNEGGSEFGNPSRPVIGVVRSTLDQTSSSSTLKKKIEQIFMAPAYASSCPADTVLATDSVGDTTLASVSDDCSFRLSLSTDKAYLLSFVRDDDFVARLIFKTGVGSISSSIFVLSQAADAVDLGDVTIEEGTATAENNPTEQNDEDGDGVDDFADGDDDSDDIPDEDEEDCDLDGYGDDDDESDSACDVGEAKSGPEAIVVEVYPYDGDEDIPVDEVIEVQFGCVVDATSIDSSTFSVASDEHEVSCAYEGDEGGDIVVCGHEGDVFLPLTTYSVSIDGVSCEDGELVAPASWSWTTEEL